ncbi:hypothetical protein [Noviherbaspirillum sp.]|uniref:hypothetical protein n=1 Tax=Noviherbaspirillum sp. TaxID=1926288 RepID=UPI002FE075D1
MIFRLMRLQGIIPTNGGNVLREPHVRILWASWHVVTALGWCVAITLLWLALPSTAQISQSTLSKAIACALLVSSLLVLVGTKGKHPGWMGLLAAAALTAVGVYQ